MKHKRYYDYIISYTFSMEGYLTPSTGTIYLSRTNKINNFDEARSVTNYISSLIEGSKNLSINNIMYLGRNKHEVNTCT